MTRKSICGPKRLLDRPGLSSYIVELLEKDYTGSAKPKEDPILATVQTKLCAAVGERPSLKQDWKRDDVRCEAFIRAHYLVDMMDATSNHISVAMTNIIKGE